MNRADLQKLSDIRIREAKVLLNSGEFSGAYYLAGYAVECALKACFARSVKRHDFPDRKIATRLYTHKLLELVALANLEEQLETARSTDSPFRASWEIVRGWSEESRYTITTKDDAEAIIDAIARRGGGVLPWIKRYW